MTDKIDKKISIVLKISSLWALLATFFGFLIVNLYLAFFGSWDPEFLKVQYLTAGTLFLILIVVPVIFLSVYFLAKNYFKKYREVNSGWWTKVWTRIVTSILFFLGMYLSFSFFTSLTAFGNIHLSPVESIYAIATVWIIIIWSILWIFFKSKDELSQAAKEDSYKFKKLFLSAGAYYKFFYVFIVIPTLMLIFLWAVYPMTPRYFGGGQATAVRIGLVEEFKNEQIGVSNPFDALLVHQSSDSFLILTTSGEVYTLRKSDISFFRHLESNAVLDALKSNKVNLKDGSSSKY